LQAKADEKVMMQRLEKVVKLSFVICHWSFVLGQMTNDK